jgi:hypothetical protein
MVKPTATRPLNNSIPRDDHSLRTLMAHSSRDLRPDASRPVQETLATCIYGHPHNEVLTLIDILDEALDLLNGHGHGHAPAQKTEHETERTSGPQ